MAYKGIEGNLLNILPNHGGTADNLTLQPDDEQTKSENSIFLNKDEKDAGFTPIKHKKKYNEVNVSSGQRSHGSSQFISQGINIQPGH